MKLEMKVTAGTLNVRKGPSVSYKSIRTLSKNQIVFATELKSGWYKIGTDEWASASYLQLVKDHTTGTVAPVAKVDTSTTSKGDPPPPKEEVQALKSRQLQEYAFQLNPAGGGSYLGIRRVYGIPHKFTNNTDVTVTGTNYGRKYTETIISDIPLLQLSPGIPSFLNGLDAKSKDAVIKIMGNGASKEGMLDQIMSGKNAKYYTFEYAGYEYFNYVNTLCRMSAFYLGLSDVSFNGGKLGSYNWTNHQSDLIADFGSSVTSVCFYVDASSSMSESMSNETSKSMLDGALDGFSDAAKEAQFLFGAGGVKIDAMSTQNYEEDITELAKKLGQNPNSLLTKLEGGINTIIKGGNLLFPEIWRDSSYSKSYDISLKLISPYGDKLSVYLNIIVPFLHLIAMVMPRTFTANGYISPYLVRGFAKGWMNCDFGIIDNFSWKKGGSGDAWSKDGLPLELDVNFSIKDMYNSLSMTDISAGSLLYGNIGLIDFISSLSGININKPELARKLNMAIVMELAKISNIPTNMANKVEQDIYKKWKSFFLWK